MHVRCLELAHNICSMHVAHRCATHYKVLSTPSNKMGTKYYFTFLESIPTKSESATFFYNLFQWLYCHWLSDIHMRNMLRTDLGQKQSYFI